jgi:hypothetical protein
MAVDEADRLRLYEAARRALGHAEADTLMSSLAPYPWDQFATKADLETGLARLESGMLDRMSSMLRTIVLAMMASNATLVGLVVAAIQLGR